MIAAGALFPSAQATIAVVRLVADLTEHVGLARIALPDGVIAAAAEEQRQEAERLAAEHAAAGCRIAEAHGLSAAPELRSAASAWRALLAAADDVGADVLVC